MAWAGMGGQPQGGMLVVERQHIGRGGLLLSPSGQEGNNSREVGGRVGCRCYIEVVWGQQQQGDWWRGGRRGLARVWESQTGCEAAATAGRLHGGNGEAGEIGAKAVEAIAAIGINIKAGGRGAGVAGAGIVGAAAGRNACDGETAGG